MYAKCILRYDEAQRGREEGAKNRSCVITHTLFKETKTFCFTAPITHTVPNKESGAVEIPFLTKQRPGLDYERSRIMANELNPFEWPGFDYAPCRISPERRMFTICRPAR